MKDSKVRVIFCTDGIFPHMVGGIQRHSRLLAESLAKSGQVKLTVIHPHRNIKVFDPELNIEEIIIPEEKSTGIYLRDCYRYSVKVLQVVRDRPEAIVYAQGFAVWAGMEKIKNRLILNPHGLEPFQGLSKKNKLLGLPFRMILRYQFRSAGYIVSLGGRLTGLLQQNSNGAQIVVLPNAVNVPEKISRTFDASPVRFLFVGRFAFNKGIDVLAQAVKELNKEGYEKKTDFTLVGKGELYDQYTSEYVFPNLHYKGFASDPDLEDLYKKNDVFILPTLFEGMPTVVLEAMAYGMPIIVTDTGATTEMVDQSNGYIIEKKDVASLKNAIINYLNLEPAKRKELSENSYNRVKKNFTWSAVAEKHIQLFREIESTLKHD